CADLRSSAEFSPCTLESRTSARMTATTAPKVSRPAGTLHRDSQARTSCLRRFNSVSGAVQLRGPIAQARTLQAMDELARTPVVPLEAGAGPENPPCPACR